MEQMKYDAEAFRALAEEPRCCDTEDCRDKRTANALRCAVDEAERLRAFEVRVRAEIERMKRYQPPGGVEAFYVREARQNAIQRMRAALEGEA